MHYLDLKLVSELQNDNYINVNFGAMDLAADLQRKVPSLHTAPRDPVSMWVYRPQDTYVMGFVAYANYQNNPDAEMQYIVVSPNITNSKYKHGLRQNASSSTSRAKAVKNAAKYLRPLTTAQVIDQAQDGFSDKLYKVKAQARSEAYAATAGLNKAIFEVNPYGDTVQSRLHHELKHIIQSGHTFLDKQLEAELHAAFAAVDTFEELKRGYRHNHIFVETYTVGGQMRFRGCDDVHSSRSAAGLGNLGSEFNYAHEDLPEGIAGKLSVLFMVEEGQYVTGVGYRAAPNMFYLAKDE